MLQNLLKQACDTILTLPNIERSVLHRTQVCGNVSCILADGACYYSLRKHKNINFFLSAPACFPLSPSGVQMKIWVPLVVARMEAFPFHGLIAAGGYVRGGHGIFVKALV